MFNKFITISLILSILALPVRFAFPYLWYFSNYDYIVKELCVNRHIPGSECNGRCQLTKMVGHHSSEHGHGEHNTTAKIEIRTLVNFLFINTVAPELVRESNTDSIPLQSLLYKTQYVGEPLTPPPLSLI